MITVMAATGRIGKRITELLLAAGENVRALGRYGIVVHEFLGHCDISFAEATRIVGGRIGKPDLKYVQFPYAETVKALTEFGFSENIATLEVEVAHAANEGEDQVPPGPHSKEHHGHAVRGLCGRVGACLPGYAQTTHFMIRRRVHQGVSV
jgi:hypothetical protein